MLLIESSYSIPQTLQYHETLNPALWTPEEHLKPDVRDALLRIADSFIESLEPTISRGLVRDICLTGSNANYNYTDGSDCDIHILFDFPSKIYEDFAQAKKTVWNTKYKVSIHGFPAEIYPHNAKEPIVEGSGWYSISKDEWIQKPIYQNNVDVSNPAIIQVAEKISKQIEFVIRYKVTDLTVLHHLGEKIWNLRDQAKAGEFSINNLAFKELRNSGWTDKFINYMQEIQNKQLTV